MSLQRYMETRTLCSEICSGLERLNKHIDKLRRKSFLRRVGRKTSAKIKKLRVLQQTTQELVDLFQLQACLERRRCVEKGLEVPPKIDAEGCDRSDVSSECLESKISELELRTGKTVEEAQHLF